jgi:tRNA (guanine37-N1)-methyltransferase
LQPYFPGRKLDDLTPDARQFLTTESSGFEIYIVELDYDYWTAGSVGGLTAAITMESNYPSTSFCIDEILQAILPDELCKGSPTGFAMTGHIG